MACRITMDFLLYKKKIDDFVKLFYQSVKNSIDLPNYVGTICSFDILPHNNEIYPIELNTNILLIYDTLAMLDFTYFGYELKKKGYNRVIFNRHGKKEDFDEETDSVYHIIKKQFQNANLDFEMTFQERGFHEYKREKETDFILQHKWNFSFIDNLAISKTDFLNFLKKNFIINVNDYKCDFKDYPDDVPTHFYKNPNLDVGKGVFPLSYHEINLEKKDVQVSVNVDRVGIFRSEICSRHIITSENIYNINRDSPFYFFPKYEKNNNLKELENGCLTFFEKNNKTHIPLVPVFLENYNIEMGDGSFKKIKDIVKGDVIKFYKFDCHSHLNYEYFLDYKNFHENYYQKEKTWSDQKEKIDPKLFFDIKNYKPINFEIKGIIESITYELVKTDYLDFPKERHIVGQLFENNNITHTHTQNICNGIYILNKNNEKILLKSNYLDKGLYKTYQFIIDLNESFIPYFLNINNNLILLF